MPAVECKDSAQVANLTSTETEEIMNRFMEGESYLVFANAAPTYNLWVERKKSCRLGRGYVIPNLVVVQQKNMIYPHGFCKCDSVV